MSKIMWIILLIISGAFWRFGHWLMDWFIKSMANKPQTTPDC